MNKYKCTVCGWIYDPEVGDPDGGIAPGTPFEKIPETGNVPCVEQQKVNLKK